MGLPSLRRLLAPPRDILMDLARCRERDLVLVILGVRVAFVLYSLFCVHVLPLLFLLPPKFLLFDTGELLYDDDRLTGMRNWDGVHFFHIAAHGYSHENLHVFFPFVPLLIRLTSFLTKDVCPILHRIAPVSFYVCLLNILACAFAGVVLRRLTLLTLLGPEAHDLVTRENHYSKDRKARGTKRQSGEAGPRAKSTEETALEAAVEYRVRHSLTGTMLDSFPPIRGILGAGGTSPRRCGTAQMVQILWRVAGGAVLCWIATPSMIFTVAVYTESCFSFLTFAGVYLLARFPAATAPQGKDCTGTCLTFPFPSSTKKRGKRSSSSDRDGDGGGGGGGGDCQDSSPPLPSIHWRQAYTSADEVMAVLCFTTAALSRSNAFVCGGFLLYPTFIRACFPALYRRRWSCIHGHYLAKSTEAGGGRSPDRKTATQKGSKKSPMVVYTLHPPCGRIASLPRLLVLFIEILAVLTPYILMNYHGWKVYVPMWSAEEQQRIGRQFWKLYGMLQKKYWNVGFLTAYTVVNSPNVVISLPIGFIILYCSFHYYLKPSLAAVRRKEKLATSSPRLQEPPSSSSPSLLLLLGSLVLSANVVYLWVLGLIAFTVMHVQVANRFLMSSPALYWLTGFQLAIHPRNRVSKAILLISVIWALVGGLLFPNHLPWT